MARAPDGCQTEAGKTTVQFAALLAKSGIIIQTETIYYAHILRLYLLFTGYIRVII